MKKKIILVLAILSISLFMTTFYYYSSYMSIKDKADFDRPDENGDTLLRWAIYRNEPLFVQFLIENGADVNYRNKWNWTPLFWAVHYNNTRMVEYLLNNSADITIKDYENDTVYDYSQTLLKVNSEKNFTRIDEEIILILENYLNTYIQ